MRPLLRQLFPAVVAVVLATVVLGIGYPLAVFGVARVGFRDNADGSLLRRDGEVVGSRLIGQPFSQPQYFHPRPSSAGDGYDAMASGGSNLGPTNPTLIEAVTARAGAYRAENGLGPEAKVPVDAVTASGSGLDPEISVANARLQAPRVAAARGLPVDEVLALVTESTEGRDFGILDDPGVNVLTLNLALDAAT